MRILYVTDGFPYPLTSGALRHYYLIRELSRRHDVTLLSLVDASHTDADAHAMEPFVKRQVRLVVVRSLGVRKQVERARSALGGVFAPSWVRAIRQTSARLIDRDGVDVVLLSGKRTAVILGIEPRVPVVADLCDATSSRVRGRLRTAPVHARIGIALEYARMRRLEAALLSHSQHALFISERDRELVLRGLRTPAPPISIVANGVDAAYWHRSTSILGRDEIVFTGKMDYPPNEDAAVLLVRRILPIVRRTVPTATVTIAGRNPTPRVRALTDDAGVLVTGFVPDIRPYLQNAAVFAAPLRFGSGIQNKVLEAMAMGVPVVASPLVAAGLSAPDGEPAPITAEASIEGFAASVVLRLRDAANGVPPNENSRHFVQRYFDWPSNAATLEAALMAASTVQC